MLSYQHGYHAGNLADVHKHSALAALLTYMVQQHPEPLVYMETHSGRGVYDLADAQAQKTKECDAGILSPQIMTRIPESHPYAQVQAITRKRYGQHWYGASPQIARCVLRPTDELHYFELHPQEFAALRMRIKASNIRLYKKDGYAGALSLAGGVSGRRGVVLVDPSYEVKTEYRAAAEFVLKLRQKWPQALVLVWYPLLQAALHKEMLEMLSYDPIAPLWVHEALFPEGAGLRMLGSGLCALGTGSSEVTHLENNIISFT